MKGKCLGRIHTGERQEKKWGRKKDREWKKGQMDDTDSEWQTSEYKHWWGERDKERESKAIHIWKNNEWRWAADVMSCQECVEMRPAQTMSGKETVYVCVCMLYAWTSRQQRQKLPAEQRAACPFLSHFHPCQSVSQSLHYIRNLGGEYQSAWNQAARVRLTAHHRQAPDPLLIKRSACYQENRCRSLLNPFNMRLCDRPTLK